MIVPIPALWSRQRPEDPQGKIDRALYDRSHRLMAGLSIDHRFRRVHGALAVTVGHGKYLRLRHVIELSKDIPRPVAEACQSFVKGLSSEAVELASLRVDIASLQANVVEQIKREAGKYVDRVMAVAVSDPGIWAEDFDGKETYTGLTDATRLAELSGVTVIDDFSARDLAVGGRGAPLEPIPLWLLLADRNGKVASQNRAVICAGGSQRDCGGYLLPASDGLDAELPSVQRFSAFGFSFLGRLGQLACEVRRPVPDLDKLYAEGKSDESLLQMLVAVLDVHQRNGGQIGPAEIEQCGQDQISANQICANQISEKQPAKLSVDERLLSVVKSYLAQHPQRLASAVRTSVVAVVDATIQQMQRLTLASDLTEIWVAAQPSFEASIINRFGQKLHGIEVNSIAKHGFTADSLPALTTAILGLLHVDQMPANVPWLTGADGQRILGRLTPGRPSNWRQLVRAMADFQPPAMKLRDAV